MSTDQPIGPGRDRRRGARFISAEPQANSTLLVGRKKVPAQILDESAGGFCIQVEQDPRVEVDAVVRLRTAMGCYEVRVANVSRDEDNRQSSYRLGLQRLRELEITPLPGDKIPWMAMAQHIMPGSSLAGAVVFILALLIAAPLTAVGVMFGLDNFSLKQITTWTGSPGYQTPSQDSSRSLRRFLPLLSSSETTDTPSAAAQATSSPGRSRLPAPEQIRTMLTHAPGAEALLLPDMAKHLALTASQKQRLRELVEASNQALDQFDQYTQGVSRHERSRKRELLFSEARRQALMILTPEQRTRWNALQNP